MVILMTLPLYLRTEKLCPLIGRAREINTSLRRTGGRFISSNPTCKGGRYFPSLSVCFDYSAPIVIARAARGSGMKTVADSQ